MKSVLVSYEKYAELSKALSDPVLGTKFGSFNKTYGSVGTAPEFGGDGVFIHFDNDEKAAWFLLKYA